VVSVTNSHGRNLGFLDRPECLPAFENHLVMIVTDSQFISSLRVTRCNLGTDEVRSLD
jgi:hypothetical protein